MICLVHVVRRRLVLVKWLMRDLTAQRCRSSMADDFKRVRERTRCRACDVVVHNKLIRPISPGVVYKYRSSFGLTVNTEIPIACLSCRKAFVQFRNLFVVIQLNHN